MRPHVVALTLSGSLLAAAGCGSTGGGGTAAPPPAAASGNTAPAAAAKHLTADQVAKALQARGLPVKRIVVFDESTDPNGKLGRPGQYTSKVNFTDPRAKGGPQAEGGKDVSAGGSVEVFSDPAGAVSRGTYIQTVLRGAQILGSEYDYISGGVLLRLSGDIPPSGAKKYETAFESIVGGPVVTPTPARS